jgi:phage-related protein
MSREIKFYRTEAGHCPVEEFLDSLSGRQAQKVTWVLRLVEEMAVVPAKYFKKLASTEDIWEARVDFGPDTFRLFGFLDGPRTVVLTHGFRKKTQKAPKQAIALAQERRRDYFRRKKHE